jgi:hypothetical protein
MLCCARPGGEERYMKIKIGWPRVCIVFFGHSVKWKEKKDMRYAQRDDKNSNPAREGRDAKQMCRGWITSRELVALTGAIVACTCLDKWQIRMQGQVVWGGRCVWLQREVAVW